MSGEDGLPKRTYLVQRLTKPMGGRMGAFSEAFAFGGGLRHGGVSDGAMDLLRQVFAFDYMGAAEFEWGAVPKALDGMLRRGRLSAWSFVVADRQFYGLADDGWRAAVESTVADWVADPYGCRLKGATYIDKVDDGRVVGWLELDNGFFVFADEATWRGTADLFGVKS